MLQGVLYLYPFNRKLCGLQNLSGRTEAEISLLPLQGIELQFVGPPVRSMST
jgi:hypothetical protein